MDESKDMYTVPEVAEVLRVSPWTVKYWLRKQRIEGIKVGRQWRIRREVVDQLRGLPKEDLLAYINRQLGSISDH